MTCYVVIISSAENQIVVYAFFIEFRFLHIIVELDKLYLVVLVLEYNFK